MAVDIAIVSAKALVAILLAIQVVGLGVFFERKVSAVIQNRIGANRASISRRRASSSMEFVAPTVRLANRPRPR